MPFSYRKLSNGRRVNQNQGGGDKLQGLGPTGNMSSWTSRAVRQSAGGERRNWFFNVNQLAGGVGKMYSNNYWDADGARGVKNGPGPWGN
tara:strand:- start:46 stop:315 length:270 start_codon:yes stop_codon:yes gene_type:complete